VHFCTPLHIFAHVVNGQGAQNSHCVQSGQLAGVLPVLSPLRWQGLNRLIDAGIVPDSGINAVN
jgi:hypothetical protein